MPRCLRYNIATKRLSESFYVIFWVIFPIVYFRLDLLQLILDVWVTTVDYNVIIGLHTD